LFCALKGAASKNFNWNALHTELAAMFNIFDQLLGKKAEAAAPRDLAALLAPLAMPAVHVDKTDLPSLSHFGGEPNLPDDISWPELRGEKLGFLARLSLTEIRQAYAVSWLPMTGALLFFYDMVNQPWGYDPKDRGGSVVLVVPDLAQKVAPLDLGPEGTTSPFPHRNIAFNRIDVFPGSQRAAVRQLQLSDTEVDEMAELEDAVFDSKPKHQISGFPSAEQNDMMELECQLVTNGLYCGDSSGYKDPRAEELGRGADQWKLLFQFDTDDELDNMWGDAGLIYFWVEERAARSGDFSNTWLVLQCG
jgi:uncharacterized protein YwqG